MSAPRAPDPPASAPRPPLRADDGRLARGRRSRARIREAARAQFREAGFDGATLRAIAARAGMGASSIYRHVRSKHELLILELADLQEEAWNRFRLRDDPRAPTRQRIRDFFEAQHELLAADPDLTVIALRATTYPADRVSKRVLALNDRTVGLLAEILQGGRLRDLDPDLDVLA
ncbi:MAG: TetR/AcrR family transcriptional regulator, partial [Myxococcota bacterium]